MRIFKLTFTLILIFFSKLEYANIVNNDFISTIHNSNEDTNEAVLYPNTTSLSKSENGTIFAGRHFNGEFIRNSSILKTKNNGLKWEEIKTFPDIDSETKILETNVKTSPNDSDSLFVYFLTEKNEFYPVLLHSVDSGKNWNHINIKNIISDYNLGKVYNLDIQVSPKDKNTAYILINGDNNSKIFKYTKNETLNQVDINTNYFDMIVSIEIGKQNPDIIYASGFTCLYRSKDAGQYWETLTCSSTFDNSFKKLKVDPKNDNIIYGIPYKLNTSYESVIIKQSIDGGYNWVTKFSETTESKYIDLVGVSLDIDNNNSDKVIVTYLSTDKRDGNNQIEKSYFLESLDKGQTWRQHSPELGENNLIADAIYIESNKENHEPLALLSSHNGLYLGKSELDNNYLSTWSILPINEKDI